MLIERLTKLALLGSSWVLYLLLVLSVVSIATMVERWVYFAKRSGNVEQRRPKLVERLDAADLSGLDEILANDSSLQSRIAREAIRWLGGGTEAMADAVDAELARIRTELERGTNFLGTLGNNAPFIGLFGTVLGVIISFHSLGASGGNVGAMGGVMGGIAEALVATGVGLFVALPAVVAYNLIQRKIGQVEADAAALVKLISAYAKSDPRIIERAKTLADARRRGVSVATRSRSEADESNVPSSGEHVVAAGEAQG